MSALRLVGVFGGTFDPVHVGHLRAALELRELLELDELRFVPSGLPPHRDPPFASGEQRAAMLDAALAGEPGLVVDRCEIERPGPSYTIDTLASMREKLADTALCLVLGHDAWCGLDRWQRWRDVFELAHVVVTGRPGSNEPAGAVLEAERRVREVPAPRNLRERGHGAILFCEITRLEISASRLRAFAAAGRSLRFLVPDPVRDLIESERYYQRKS